MADVQIHSRSVRLHLTGWDTEVWAHYRDGEYWPCSATAENDLVLEFDSNGLVGLTANGGRTELSIPTEELNAITVDHLQGLLPKNHICYPVVVGQFLVQ